MPLFARKKGKEDPIHSVAHRIHIETGDYIEGSKNVDAIVNVTNYTLLPLKKNGLDDKIFDAAENKDGLIASCKAFRGGCAGQAMVTESYFPKKYGIGYIIHVIGPDTLEISRIQAREILRTCYNSVLDTALEKGFHSVSFPCIEIGQQGNRRREMTVISFGAILEWLECHYDCDISVKIMCESNDFEKLYDTMLTNYKRNGKADFQIDENTEKIGLVLQGGGAKGAFAFGVYKYLEETGLFKNISGVSGTSIGAVNSALFLSRNLTVEEKEQIWLDYKQKDLVFDKSQNRLKEKLDDAFKDEDHESDDALWNRNIDVFTTIAMKSTRHYDYRSWHNARIKEIKDYILGSAAYPILFKAKSGRHHITDEKEKYVDGGTPGFWAWRGARADTNVPIEPLYEKGYRKFLVIYLKTIDELKEEIIDEENRYGDAFFCRVIPSESLGDMKKINRELTEKRIKSGYNAMKNEMEGRTFRWWSKLLG